MRSAKQVLDRVNALRPNGFQGYLAEYLESFELRVKASLLSQTSPEYNEDCLALDAPEDMIYDLYLFTVIDFLNGEYGRYENSSSAFLSAWETLVTQAYTNKNESDSSNGSPDTNSEGAGFRIW